jgi:hypothetical protein
MEKQTRLKKFNGLPHELGGLDYTYDAEVEGKLGKDGKPKVGEVAYTPKGSKDEYIFRKGSKQIKELDKINNLLSKRAPGDLSDLTFDSIARKLMLENAQELAFEGIDAFGGGKEVFAVGGVNYYDEPDPMGEIPQIVDTPSEQPSNNTMSASQVAGYAQAAGNISNSLGQLGPDDPYAQQGIGQKNTGTRAAEATTDSVMAAIPMVGKFYGAGKGISGGIEAGRDAARADDNKEGAEVAAYFAGMADPMGSTFDIGADWESGVISTGDAIGANLLNLVAFGGIGGAGDAALESKRRKYAEGKQKQAGYDAALAERGKIPQSNEVVRNRTQEFKNGGVKSTDPTPELYNLQRAKELGYKPDETGHMPSVDETNGMWLKSKDHPTAFKELMAYTLNLDLNKQLNHPVVNTDGYFGDNQLQYTEKSPYKNGGMRKKYGNGGLIEPIGYTEEEIKAMGDADPFRVEWNSPVPGPEFFTQATMNGNYDNPDIRPAKPKYKEEPIDADTPYSPVMDNFLISQEDADAAYNYSLDKNAQWNPPTDTKNGKKKFDPNMISSIVGNLGQLGPSLAYLFGDGKDYDKVKYPTYRPDKVTADLPLRETRDAFASTRDVIGKYRKLDLGALSALATQESKARSGVRENIANVNTGMMNDAQLKNIGFTIQAMNDEAANKGQYQTNKYEAAKDVAKAGALGVRQYNMSSNDEIRKQLIASMVDQKFEEQYPS